MNVPSPTCSHGQCPERRSRPMWGRAAFGVPATRLQATDHGQYGHLTIIKGILNIIETRSVAAIDPCLGTGTIQIAIAGGTG